MLTHFQTLLEGVVANPDQHLAKLPLLTEAERQQLLVEWNKTQANYPSEVCLHQLFEAQVERTPDAIAVVFEDKQLTYRELNQRANQLANYLQKLGVEPEVLVGICVERSVEMIVGLLGILKAGGAYVALDPTYPQERLGFIISDSRVPVLVTHTELLSKLPEHHAQVICLDADWEKLAQESRKNPVSGMTVEHLAYVIYTSGSTGKPKGVLINHYDVARLLAATQSWFHFGESEVWTLFHSYAFDFSVWELWGPLLYGGQLIVVPYWISRSPDVFYELLCKEQVTVLSQTPSAFRQLIRVEELPETTKTLSLRLVIFGGEALELQSLKPWFERHGDKSPQLVNMYGITETTVHVTYRPLVMADLSVTSGSVIGRPIPDLQVYVLDRHRQPVPIGVPGEMYIGGAGLARGYLNRPDLTAEKFVPHSFSNQPSERLYRSGDLASYLPNGDIEYLGRIDDQVKLRGFRIELGEIEAALAQHPAVRETVVLVRETQPGDKHLVGYVVPNNEQTPKTSELHRFLKKLLPEYMVPSAFVLLEALPLTPNGKVNRRALPVPDTARPELEEAFAAPETLKEKKLAEIWAQVLGFEHVGIHDNFFALGGDSIRSIQVRSQAQEQGLNFSLQQLFQHQTIHELALNITMTEAGTATTERIRPFELISEEDRLRLPNDVEDAYPLTMLQMGMLFHSEQNSETATYHNVSSIHLQAPFNLEHFQTAARQLAARHPVLRTSFNLIDFNEPLQLVHKVVNLPLQIEDIRHLPSAKQEELLTAWLETEKKQNFDWTQAPLLRFHVHRRSEETFQFSLTEHHAILDGWSVASMLTELFRLYISHFGKEIYPVQPLPTSKFRDFVALERKAIGSEEHRDYWVQKLSNSTISKIPRWPNSNQVATNRQVNVQEVTLTPEVSGGLRQLAQSASVTVKSVLLAAHLRVMSLLNGQSDIMTGLVSNGRPEDPDGERVLGLFLNTVPFCLKLPGGTWTDLVRDTFKAEQEILPFRRYPMAELQRVLGKQPLFETAFNFVHFHVYQGVLNLEDIQVLDVKAFQKTNFTLIANFSQDPSSSQVRLHLEYEPTALCKDQIKAISGYYVRTLTAMASEPSGRYEDHSLLSMSEQQKLLVEWNNTSIEYPHSRCIHQLFEAQVEQTPEAVAVVYEDKQLTYRELNARANQLAHHLRSLGVEPEVLVGICVERSLEMVVGLLAILKAGGAYMPLDPAYPHERLAFILQDAQVSVLLTQQQLVKVLQEHQIRLVCLDANWESVAHESGENPIRNSKADNLAYAIYTSGSTGQPKGVLINHANVVRLFRATQSQFHFNEQDVWTLFHSYAFDFSVWEFWGALLYGGQLVVVPYWISRSPEAFYDLLCAQQVSVLNQTPSAFRQLIWAEESVEAAKKLSLRLVIFGGEALEIQSLKPWFERHGDQSPQLVNMYGITETTVHVTYRHLTIADLEVASGSIIGRPIPDLQVYILDRHQQPLPIGVPGEMYVGGAGLARGYLNQPELTAKKFTANPYSNKSNARLYRSGDLARYLPNGELEYLGRIDHQVKIRGFRIELGEIEAALSQHPGVRETVVVVQEKAASDKCLVAYVALHPEQTATITELRRFLEGKLPNYMIPSAFVMLETLPLTPNGKVDRRSLPAPDLTQLQPHATFIAPSTPTEEMLAGIWAEILGVEKVGTHDNFFELGGHSLLATRVISQLRKVFQVELPLSRLFEAPTVSTLAEYIETAIKKGQGLDAPPIKPVPRDGELPMSFAQQRLWFLHQSAPDSAAYSSSTAVHLQGALNVAALEQSINEIVRRHEALRTSFAVLNGQPIQVIAPTLSLSLSVVDLRELQLLEREQKVQRLANQEAQQPFDLMQGPLMRVTLLRLGNEEHILLLTMHHIISDGWSAGVFIREIAALYDAFCKGQPSPLPELLIQYADFAVWQRQWLQGKTLETQLAYWKQQLGPTPPILNLPTDRPHSSVQTDQGAKQFFALSQTLTEGLKTLSQQEGATLFMTLLTAFKVLLYHYTSQEDIVVGSPVANRNRSEIEGLIGFFVNTLVMRTDLSSNPSFRETLGRVREVALGAYTHQDLPFEKLVTELQPERNLGHNPLFQVWFVLQNAPMPALELPGLTLNFSAVETGAVRHDLKLDLTEIPEGVKGFFEYKTDLFESSTITQMAELFQTTLATIVELPDIKLSELVELLNNAEKELQTLKNQEFKQGRNQKLKNIRRKSITGFSQ
jgi:amino acid adenylation domain-containing protein